MGCVNDSTRVILGWAIEMLYGLKRGEQVGFFDKINCVLLVCLAATQLRLCDAQKAGETLLRRHDGILVLKNGRIEESGSFEELMEKKGYFYALFKVAQ